MDKQASERIIETVESIAKHTLPRWNELPDLDIYMDQVLSLMSRYFDGYQSSDDKGLTSSMVNNYVKLGIMPAPKSKKYNREHLAHLIIICVLKTVMPIGQIGQLISEKVGNDSSYEKLYDRFCDYYESSVSAITQSTERLAEKDCDCVDIIFSSALRAHAEQAVALGLMKLSPEEQL
ncbi:MAG: DUF1836 domain-containing protein [Bacillota bacterium]|nr:DUF1836 domain-containing protein [Bacillota bacterium]